MEDTMYKNKGVRVGFKHIWKYGGGLWKERKVRKGLWKFIYKSSKGKKSKSYGSFGKNTTGVWLIKAKQYIVKRGIGKYDTTMIGTKRPLKFNVKNPRRRKY